MTFASPNRTMFESEFRSLSNLLMEKEGIGSAVRGLMERMKRTRVVKYLGTKYVAMAELGTSLIWV